MDNIAESKRIGLRNYKLSDIDDYFDYISDPNVADRLGFPPYKTKEDALKRLEYEVNEKPLQFAIVWKEANKVIGSIEIMDPNRDEKSREKFKARYCGIVVGERPFEIGFLLSPKFWGRGIMPEATVLATDYCFNELGASEVCIGHLKANLQSGRVQEKIGFEIVNEIETDRVWIDGNVTTSVRRIMTKEHWQKIRAEKIAKYVK